jgi:hypothetical protein
MGHVCSLERRARFRDARPLAYMRQSSGRKAFWRAGKTRLVGIATRHKKKTNHPVREAKIFRYEKEVAALSPKLRTQLSAAAWISSNADTTARICWNYAAKSDKRRLLLAFAWTP